MERSMKKVCSINHHQRKDEGDDCDEARKLSLQCYLFVTVCVLRSDGQFFDKIIDNDEIRQPRH